MLEILERICNGEGREGDIELLQEIAVKVKEGSLCGLGQSAPNPVLTTIRYFRDEYEAHIKDKKCPAKQCKSLSPSGLIRRSAVGADHAPGSARLSALPARRKNPMKSTRNCA
ncbi:MAG: NADH-ubiquinone oxidoreductase-F iron-sulfur binding region domain-containing protein [Thermoanaerobacterales bacterium]|nr:NADH-ubiquinone oxidoreductase-F iron-sulfur binding region domain-containing protein [Thermoanaerobacterales bacterium]